MYHPEWRFIHALALRISASFAPAIVGISVTGLDVLEIVGVSRFHSVLIVWEEAYEIVFGVFGTVSFTGLISFVNG
jgi:hypothetical protein